MGMKPGEVFVTRNIANVVNTLDMSSTAVIQYAVEHLKVKPVSYTHLDVYKRQIYKILLKMKVFKNDIVID